MPLELAKQALPFWGLEGASIRLVAQRENAVFRLSHARGNFALRVHRADYRSRSELQSELAWMAVLGKAGLTVPHPVATLDGEPLAVVAGRAVDLLHWVSGVQLGTTGQGIEVPDPVGTIFKLGQTMGWLHNLSDGWERPAGFQRPSWDRAGLLGDAPLWGRFWENPALSGVQAQLLVRARDVAQARLQVLDRQLDYGLIHADMLFENILVDGMCQCVIDFDDGGFGYRLFDLATTALRLEGLPQEAGLQRALLAGYRNERVLDETELPLFVMLRALSYVGWIATRRDVPNWDARQKTAIKVATAKAAQYLAEE